MTQIRVPRLLLYAAGQTFGMSFVGIPVWYLVECILNGIPIKFEIFAAVPVGVLILYLISKRAKSLGMNRFVWDKTGPYLTGD